MKKLIIGNFIILAVMLLFIIIALIIANSNKKETTYSSVKEIMKAYECDYKKSQNSMEDGFRKDYYVTFKYRPVDEDGSSHEKFFDSLISDVITLERFNLRLIDEIHDITIRVLYDGENNKSEYTINGVKNYYSTKTIETQKELANDALTTNVNVKSKQIESLMDNDWVRRDSDLGEVVSSKNGYSVYENGYRTKTLGTKVFNIVFDETYEDAIINNLGTYSSRSDIRNSLGNATYETDKMLGYRTKDFYIFFESEPKEVSIYSITKFDEEKNKKFSRYFEGLLKKTGTEEDINDFLKQVTHLYENFETYERTDDYISLVYPDLGFSIYFAQDSDHILTLYSNYEGEVVEKYTINDLANEGKAIPYVQYKLNENSYEVYELKRVENDNKESTEEENVVNEIEGNGVTELDENMTSTVDELFGRIY